MLIRCPWCKKGLRLTIFQDIDTCPKCKKPLRKFTSYKYTPWEAILILGLPLGALYAVANYFNDSFIDFGIIIFYPLGLLVFAFDNLQVELKRDKNVMDEKEIESQEYSKYLLAVLLFLSTLFIIISYRIIS